MSAKPIGDRDQSVEQESSDFFVAWDLARGWFVRSPDFIEALGAIEMPTSFAIRLKVFKASTRVLAAGLGGISDGDQQIHGQASLAQGAGASQLRSLSQLRSAAVVKIFPFQKSAFSCSTASATVIPVAPCSEASFGWGASTSQGSGLGRWPSSANFAPTGDDAELCLHELTIIGRKRQRDPARTLRLPSAVSVKVPRQEEAAVMIDQSSAL